MRRSWSSALLLLGACASQDLTEVVVTVEPEPSVLAQAPTLSVTVAAEPAGSAAPHLNSSAQWNADGKFVVVLAPRRASARETYRLEVSALRDGRPLATARLVSGYVTGETRYVRLRLEDDCIGVSCPGDSSCHDGACIAASAPARDFARGARSAPLTTELAGPAFPPTSDGGVQGPGPDPLSDGGLVGDAGPMQSPMTPVQPVSDAGPTIDPSAARCSQAASDGDVCKECIAARCCPEFIRCLDSEDLECYLLQSCINTCYDDACVEICEDIYPGGIPTLYSLLDCAESRCANEC